jgi:hypothetical protein
MVVLVADLATIKITWPTLEADGRRAAETPWAGEEEEEEEAEEEEQTPLLHA